MLTPRDHRLAARGAIRPRDLSLIASTLSIGLVGAYAQNLLPPTVVARPLQGNAPSIDLVIGYSKESTSPLLKRFLSRVEDLIERVSRKIA